MISYFFKMLQKSGSAAFFALSIGLSISQAQGLDRSTIAQKIDASQLAKHPTWEALLHLDANQPQIKDPSFLLSGATFNANAELLATLNFLYGAKTEAVCRFPARYLWLKDQLSLPALPLEKCADWVELSTRAPLDTLSLAFVSESVSLPASMMGHSFIKLAGRKSNGEHVEHAISFYTPAETYNLPKLYWEAMVSGKDGVFALAPYQEVNKKYLDEEKRNVWTYDLDTSVNDRLLIQAHLLELKQTTLFYWFHSYNCATLLRNLIGITGRLSPNTQWWVTPKDLVKAVNEAGLVTRTQVQLSSEWLIDHQAGLTTEPPSALTGMLAKAHLDMELSQQKINMEKWLAAVNALPDHGGQVKIEQSLNPSNSPADSQFLLGQYRLNGENRLRIGLLPLSHQFLDIQAHAQAETQLEFMSGTLSWAKASGLRLDHLNIYAMRSLNPWNSSTRRISSEFKLAYDQLAPHSLLERGFQVLSGVGGTYRAHQRLDVYGLLGLNLSKAVGAYRLWGTHEWGAVTRLGSSVKAHLSIKYADAVGPQAVRVLQRSAALTSAISKMHSINFHLSRTSTSGRTENKQEAIFKLLF